MIATPWVKGSPRNQRKPNPISKFYWVLEDISWVRSRKFLKLQKEAPFGSSISFSPQKFLEREEIERGHDCWFGVFGAFFFLLLLLMLGDGKSLDLLILYLTVRKKGGYIRVSENCLWGSVAEEFGLDVRFGFALKLFSTECLDKLLLILQRASEDKGIKSRVKDSVSDIFGGSLMDLVSNLEPFLSKVSKEIKKDTEYVKLDRKKCTPDADAGHNRVRSIKEIENDYYAKSYRKAAVDMVDLQCVKVKVLDQ